eukprot:1379031-Amphidinium_carterae.1
MSRSLEVRSGSGATAQRKATRKNRADRVQRPGAAAEVGVCCGVGRHSDHLQRSSTTNNPPRMTEVPYSTNNDNCITLKNEESISIT